MWFMYICEYTHTYIYTYKHVHANLLDALQKYIYFLHV